MNYEPVSKVEREYTATNYITGDELEYDFLIGDVADTEMTNVLGQFQGALAAFVEGVHTRTASWHTRGLAQNLPLLQLMANERAAQLATPRQFVDMTIMETAKAATALSLIGNFQDDINLTEVIGPDEIEYHLRLFYANRGTFHVKYRTWKLDLVEIGAGARIDADAPRRHNSRHNTNDSRLNNNNNRPDMKKTRHFNNRDFRLPPRDDYSCFSSSRRNKRRSPRNATKAITIGAPDAGQGESLYSAFTKVKLKF